jgi:hypothetical protein
MRVHYPVALLVVGLAACATASTNEADTRDVRMAEDTPVSFVSDDGSALGEECRNVMVDPRDQTRLRLQRSALAGSAHHGDYEVPTARYGVKDRELLRINCETGQVIGIVPVG